MADHEVIVIGAGLAGLAAAHHLQQAGVSVLVLEAGDGVGGRVRSDLYEHETGTYVLDRGFQVLLTAYPEARQILDYDALELKSFYSGALVQLDGGQRLLADPRRELRSGLRAAISPKHSPLGSFIDRARLGAMVAKVLRKEPDDAWSVPDETIASFFADAKVGPKTIDRFLRPLLGGIFLDPTLATSRRMFEYVLHMLASGDSAVPARGMQAIPDQLAANLAPGTIRLGSRVAQIDAAPKAPTSMATTAAAASVPAASVTLLDAGVVRAKALFVAAEGPQAAKLLGAQHGVDAPGSLPVTTVYFSCDRAPVQEPIIVLNGEGPDSGPVNTLAVMSNISPAYAPQGRHLVAAQVLGPPPRPAGDSRDVAAARRSSDEQLESTVRTQLGVWFGADVSSWRHLRTYHVVHAQPEQVPPALSPHERPVELAPNLFVCGDHRDQASIQGALHSGRRAAERYLDQR